MLSSQTKSKETGTRLTPWKSLFKSNRQSWEWTLLVDTFNNEILAHQATPIQGSTQPYYHCLEQLKLLVGKKNEEQTPQVVLHTDQGSVYSSQAFRQAHEHYNIFRSMSRVGTPTDNAVIDIFCTLCISDLLYQIQILLPDVCNEYLLSFFIGSTLYPTRTCSALFRRASVCSLSFPVCRGVSQDFSNRASICVSYRIVGVLCRIRRCMNSILTSWHF